MTSPPYLGPPIPALSIPLITYAAADPGTWQPMLDRARAADEAGVDRIFVSDHVVFGEHLDAYGRPELGGTQGGRQPTGPDGHWLEPMTVLALVSGITTRVRLATGILLAALRRPVVLAKSAATLDVLSGGRLDLGVGVGWQREEYEAADLRFEGRGHLLDQTLEICQTLWRDAPATLQSADSIYCLPRPRQPDGIPVWVSGTLNRPVLDRIARFGRGWIPWGQSALDLKRSIATVRDALDAAGRATDGFQIAGTLPIVKRSDGAPDLERTMEGVPPLVEVGLTDLRANLRLPDDPSATADLLGELVAAFRAVTGRSGPEQRPSPRGATT